MIFWWLITADKSFMFRNHEPTHAKTQLDKLKLIAMAWNLLTITWATIHFNTFRAAFCIQFPSMCNVHFHTQHPPNPPGVHIVVCNKFPFRWIQLKFPLEFVKLKMRSFDYEVNKTCIQHCAVNMEMKLINIVCITFSNSCCISVLPNNLTIWMPITTFRFLCKTFSTKVLFEDPFYEKC